VWQLLSPTVLGLDLEIHANPVSFENSQGEGGGRLEHSDCQTTGLILLCGNPRKIEIGVVVLHAGHE